MVSVPVILGTTLGLLILTCLHLDFGGKPSVFRNILYMPSKHPHPLLCTHNSHEHVHPEKGMKYEFCRKNNEQLLPPSTSPKYQRPLKTEVVLDACVYQVLCVYSLEYLCSSLVCSLCFVSVPAVLNMGVQSLL